MFVRTELSPLMQKIFDEILSGKKSMSVGDFKSSLIRVRFSCSDARDVLKYLSDRGLIDRPRYQTINIRDLD